MAQENPNDADMRGQVSRRAVNMAARPAEVWISFGIIQRSRLTLPLKLLRVSERVSGAMKAGVPAVLDSKASLPSNWLLTPKSAIFTWPSSPSSRFEGLMSRWMIFW